MDNFNDKLFVLHQTEDENGITRIALTEVEFSKKVEVPQKPPYFPPTDTQRQEMEKHQEILFSTYRHMALSLDKKTVQKKSLQKTRRT